MDIVLSGCSFEICSFRMMKEKIAVNTGHVNVMTRASDSGILSNAKKPKTTVKKPDMLIAIAEGMSTKILI